MRFLVVLRGRPGLGHVSPGIALCEAFANAGHEVHIVTYENGATLLQGNRTFIVHSINMRNGYEAWAGMNLIDDVCLKLRPLYRDIEPDVVVFGGEYLAPLATLDWTCKKVMLVNPEVFVNKVHNEPYQALFTEAFKSIDLLICLDEVPNSDEVFTDNTGILERAVYPGPLLRSTGGVLSASSKRYVVYSAGGGISFPETSITYSPRNVTEAWKKQCVQVTLDVLKCLSRLDNTIKVEAFLGLDPTSIAKCNQAALNRRNFKIGGLSERYWQEMQRADLVICRAGATAVGEIIALGKTAVIWPLVQHAEQERTVRRAVEQNENIYALWPGEDAFAVIQKALTVAKKETNSTAHLTAVNSVLCLIQGLF